MTTTRVRSLRLSFGLRLLATCALLAASATSALAQGASIGIYTDATGQTCSFGGNAPGVFSAYVVYRPDAYGVTAVQFSAPVPSCLGAVYVGEAVTPGMISIGNTQSGISIALTNCAREPVSVAQIHYYRTGSTDPCCPYPILPDPSAGGEVASDCAFADHPATLITSHFNADASCACEGNSPPDQPTNPNPYEGQAGVPLQPAMSWFADDFDNNLVNYDVYLGTAATPSLVASSLTEPTYTPGTLSPLTQYYWRVVARDAMGLETSSVLWTFTTRLTNTPPVAPFNPVPAPLAVNVALNQSLAWTSGDVDNDAVEYDVYFGTSSPPPVVATDLVAMFFNPGVMTHTTTYYWRVVARDSPGTESSSPEWSFTTRPPNLPPDLPQLVSPANTSTGQLLNTIIDWTSSDPDGGPLGHDVYFGTASSPPLLLSNISESQVSPTLAFETTYYWSIVVRDVLGATTSGPTWSFTTRPANYPPNVPSSPSPPNNSFDRLPNLTLTWVCGDLDLHTVTYDVYFGTETSPPLVASNVTTKSFAVAGLAELTTYRWRIVARDQLGAETTGPLWNFTTKLNDAPTNPFAPLPLNGITGMHINPTLGWSCSDVDGDPITYDVYFGTSSPPPLAASGLTTRSYSPALLAFTTQYFWQVVAHDNHDHHSSGGVWSFTTKANSPPQSPTSPNPSNNALVATSPTLTWTALDADPQALTYAIYLGTSSPPPLVASGLSQPSFPANVPLNSGQHFWRVQVSDGMTTTLGPIWNFTVLRPGDVVRDGVVNLADANCAMQIYLANPSCGGANGAGFADVDCSGLATPGDAACIHQFVVDGSCTFCGTEPSAPAINPLTPTITVGSFSTNEDTLTVRLAVSNLSALHAFGFRVATSKFKFLQARRVGPTGSFVTLQWSNPSALSAIVGAYTLGNVAVGSGVEFIELRFDMFRGLPETIVLTNFVDDFSGVGTVTIPLGPTVDVPPVAAGVVLNQNHPNPFNPQTTISYELPASLSSARVRLWILDISGRIVRRLVDEDQASGPHDVRWDGRDDGGATVSSGVYFYVLDAAGERLTRKLVLLK